MDFDANHYTKFSAADPDEVLNQQVKCLKFASDFIATVNKSKLTEGPMMIIAISKSDFNALLIKHGFSMMSEARQDYLGSLVYHLEFDKNGIWACSLWDFAHWTHHCFYDLSLPKKR